MLETQTEEFGWGRQKGGKGPTVAEEQLGNWAGELGREGSRGWGDEEEEEVASGESVLGRAGEVAVEDGRSVTGDSGRRC